MDSVLACDVDEVMPTGGRDDVSLPPGGDSPSTDPDLPGEGRQVGPTSEHGTIAVGRSRHGEPHGGESRHSPKIGGKESRPESEKTAQIGTPAYRLALARARKGFRSASSFAREIGVPQFTYLSHESGRNSINPTAAMLYAKALDVTPEFLLHGEDAPSGLSLSCHVPIVGTITGAQARITTMPYDGALGAIHIEWTGLSSFRVVGNDLYPAYRDGDHALCDALDRAHFDADQLRGRDCVVELHDGEILLRQVIPQPNGRMTLVAYHAPTMIDAEVVAGSPVKAVIRA